MATAGALLGSTGAASIFALSGQNFILTFAAASVPPAVALLWLLSVCAKGTEITILRNLYA